MKRFAILAAILIAACGGRDESGSIPLSKEPVSVRGWIADVEGSTSGEVKTIETEIARRSGLFMATSVWVENAPYASGGVANNGSFIVLDVPPGNVTISFHAPGAESARLVLQNIPGNADVLVPAILLQKNGVKLLEPQNVRVRVPSTQGEAVLAGRKAIVAGVAVPVVQAPIAAFTDRRDYPVPPGVQPVAKLK